MAGEAIEIRAFCLRLKPGAEAEYKRRHDSLWPQMRAALLEAGVLSYDIHLLRSQGLLFAQMTLRAGHTLDSRPEPDVILRWRAYMADILDQQGDGPARLPLEPMFSLRP
jgi:L-rhamnose mutarotase